jgi:hypothetical protein
VISNSGVVFAAASGAAIERSTHGFMTESWLSAFYVGNSAVQITNVSLAAINPSPVAVSFWNHAEYWATSYLDRWFPRLESCTSSPSCIGPLAPGDLMKNALKDLIARLTNETLVRAAAEQHVFTKLNASFRTTLDVDQFVNYLQESFDATGIPGFYDGTKSGYCVDALRNPPADALCHTPVVNLLLQSVSSRFAEPSRPQALTQTPSRPLKAFFRPSLILFQNEGRNRGNEGLIFHEALHGLTGRGDAEIMGALQIPNEEPICKIGTNIETNVLSRASITLDSTRMPCP